MAVEAFDAASRGSVPLGTLRAAGEKVGAATTVECTSAGLTRRRPSSSSSKRVIFVFNNPTTQNYSFRGFFLRFGG